VREAEPRPAPDSRRGFWSLFVTQFQGAFSDNVLKNLAIFIVPICALLQHRPDKSKKGEQLVVLHKLEDELLKSCLENLAQSDLPNLWKPRADRFVRVEDFPYLGTGKLDLRRIREMAEQASSHEVRE
jgi:hypothetical protein